VWGRSVFAAEGREQLAISTWQLAKKIKTSFWLFPRILSCHRKTKTSPLINTDDTDLESFGKK
jgi:hypothetical protein